MTRGEMQVNFCCWEDNRKTGIKYKAQLWKVLEAGKIAEGILVHEL